MRFGQVHGACPLTADELVQVGGLELIAGGSEQGFNGAVGQQGAQRKAQVGGVENFHAGRANGLGQVLPAKIGRVLQTLPARFTVLPVRFLEARRGGDGAIFPAGGLEVALPVQRRSHFLVEAGAFLDHRLCGFQARILETRHLGNLVESGNVLQVEEVILDGGDIAHESLR